MQAVSENNVISSYPDYLNSTVKDSLSIKWKNNKNKTLVREREITLDLNVPPLLSQPSSVVSTQSSEARLGYLIANVFLTHFKNIDLTTFSELCYWLIY